MHTQQSTGTGAKVDTSSHTQLSVEGLQHLNEVTAVAEYLHCGRTHIFALMKSGELRSIKVGRKRLVPADALREYLRRVSEIR